MRSKHRSIAVLSALVVLALAVSASAASATMLYEWKVNGTALKSGSSKELTLKTKSKVPFTFTETSGGATTKFTSSAVKFVSGKIIGGKPGTMSGHLVFENVTVEKPKNCEVVGGKIETYLLNAEIVEEAKYNEGHPIGTGVSGIVFVPPAEGGLWARFETKNKSPEPCAWNRRGWEIRGSLLATISPHIAEAKVNQLLIGPELDQYINSQKEYETTGLNDNGEPYQVTGELEAELVSKEAFGAF